MLANGLVLILCQQRPEVTERLAFVRIDQHDDGRLEATFLDTGGALLTSTREKRAGLWTSWIEEAMLGQ